MARQQAETSASPSKAIVSNTSMPNEGQNGKSSKSKRPRNTRDKAAETSKNKGKVVKSPQSQNYRGKPATNDQTTQKAATISKIVQLTPEEQNKLAAIKATELAAQSEHALKSSPLFLAQYKVAYNHNFGFSVNGGSFNLEISQLPKDHIPAAYDFVTSVYPSHAFELKKSMNAAFKAIGVAFMTRNQVTYAGKFEEKHKRLPWTLDNLIRKSTDDINVKYYKYLEKWLGLWDTSVKLKKRLEVASAQAETSKTGTQDSLEPSLQAAPIANISSASKVIFNPPMNPIFPIYALVNTAERLSEFLDVLGSLPRNGEPNLFCHAVTESSSDIPRVSLIAIHVATLQKTFILDITKLGQAAFHTLSRGSRMSLCIILEDMSTPKVFTSIKNIAEALYQHYKVLLQAVVDEEVLERNAASPSTRKGSCEPEPNADHYRWIYLAQNRYERSSDASGPTEKDTELITLGSAALRASGIVPRFVAASLKLDTSEKIKVLIDSVKKGGFGLKERK